MILAVKRPKKKYLLKIISLLIIIGIAAMYYNDLNKKHEAQIKRDLEAKQLLKIQEEKKEKKEKEKKEAEAAIITEIEKVIDLVGQEYVTNAKIIEDKLIIICQPETNLDALIVRYGAMALIKRTTNEIVIAIDINFILKSRLNAK